VTQLDHAFGALMRTLDELKVADDTLVIFTSDNGPEGDGVRTPGRGTAGGLRGRKRSLYEGGIRVPGIVRWPAGKVPSGTTSDVPVIGSDWFATVLAAAGVAGPTDRVIDGGDARPALAGQPVTRPRPLYWRWWPQAALRDGDYKVVAKVTPDGLANFELYNLAADRAEKDNLATREPDRLAAMRDKLLKLHAEVEAEGPDWWKRGAKPRNLDPEGGLPATRPATRPANPRKRAGGGT
jgi:arylsulfatase A